MKKRWTFQKWAAQCFEKNYCDCPECPVGIHCEHQDNDSGECEKEVCPTWKDRNNKAKKK